MKSKWRLLETEVKTTSAGGQVWNYNVFFERLVFTCLSLSQVNQHRKTISSFTSSLRTHIYPTRTKMNQMQVCRTLPCYLGGGSEPTKICRCWVRLKRILHSLKPFTHDAISSTRSSKYFQFDHLRKPTRYFS